jgi:hypothetical protein
LVFPGCINTTQLLTEKREKSLGNPLELIGDAFLKKKKIRMEQQPEIEEVVDKEETKNQMTFPLKEDKLGVYLETDVWIHKTNIATELAIEENSKKTEKTDEQLVLAEYHIYLDIFSEEQAHQFPESRS